MCELRELKAMDGHSSAIRRGYAMQTHICDICAMPCQCLVGALSRISLPIRLRSRGRGLRSCNLFAIDTAVGPGSTGAVGSPAWCSYGVNP